MTQETLACNRCLPTETENTDLRTALESLQQENTNLSMEIAGARTTLRTVERQLAKAKIDADRAREEAPEARTILSIMEFWKTTTGNKPQKRAMTVSSERGKLVAGQLRVYSAEDLMRAIQGAALLPYVRFGKRYVFGKSDEIQTQLDHCIGSKPAQRVEDNIDRYRRACRAAAEQRDAMWETYQRVAATQAQWMRLVMDALMAAEQGVETDDLEQLLWTRQAEGDARWDKILAPEKPRLTLVRDAA